MERDVAQLNRQWLKLVQRMVRADPMCASEFGLTGIVASKIETLSPRDMQRVCDAWRGPMFVPKSVMAVEGAIATSDGSAGIEDVVGEVGRFTFSYLQLVSGFCRVDHFLAGERFRIPAQLSRKLRDATISDLAAVCRSGASAQTVCVCNTMMERLVSFVLSGSADNDMGSMRLTVMSMATMLAEDSVKAA